jgi:hypothetical protein
MFERFTDSARRVIVLAQEEARMLHQNQTGTEHILLGLLQVGEGAATKALGSLGVSLEDVREHVVALVSQQQETPSGQMPFTPRAKNVIELSLREALQLGHNYVGTEHILLGLMSEGEGVAAQVLGILGAEFDGLREEVLRQGRLTDQGKRHSDEAGSVVLDQFGENLTHAARRNGLDAVIGRDREIEEVMQVLSRRTKSNPVLIGEPGIGKATIVDGLAEALIRGDVPERIKGMQVYKLDVDRLTSSGDGIEENLKSVLKELEIRGDIILFIEEIHSLLGEYSSIAPVDVTAEITPILAKGHFRIIGTSTLDDYRRHIERSPALHQLLAQVTVTELSISATIEHLKTVRDRLEAHYRLSITDGALAAAALLAHRYLRHQVLPESAIGLLDETGARLNIRRMAPPDIKTLDESIAAVRMEMMSAIDAQDFERAAILRNNQQELMGERSEKERAWKTSDSYYQFALDENAVVEVVALESGVPVKQVVDSLSPQHKQLAPLQIAETGSYVLLGDQPVKDANEDLLGASVSAKTIAAIISDSRASSPFVMAIDGGWGMGKSTLLHQISTCLSAVDDVKIVHFNAWTSQGERALEGLIKSVLSSLDRNSLRRGLKKVGEQRHTLLIARVFLGALARFVGAARLVDEIWNRLEIDAKGRNELRSTIFDMLSAWTRKGETSPVGKSLIVVIDDLDRCSDQVIVQICEAVKLYLDAPGLIFVIGCDYAVLRRGVSASDRGNEARIYLEKIIQVVHRLQPSNEDQLRSLIQGYARRSGTAAVFDQTVEEILSKRAGRNPRRIKRIINSFVLESRLNSAWSAPDLGNDQLIKAVIIHHLYPSFYDELISEQSGPDPIGDFLDYAEVKGRAADPPPTNDAWWSTNSKLFRRHDISPPPRSTTEREGLSSALANLEAGLPSEYPHLARDIAFISLLRGVGDDRARAALTSLLRNEPLQTETFAEVGDDNPQVLTN